MKKRPSSASSCKKRLCPLSDPAIGIVSENDHKVGLCLCRYCDCGEHSCPVLDKNEVYLKSAFKSSYMANFQRASFDSPVLKPQQRLFRPNTNKMDFQTTNQEAFKPFRITPKQAEERFVDQNKAQFRGQSVYTKDFPDWGENHVNHEKRWYAPVRSTEIAFIGKSTYRESFKDEVCKSSQSLRVDPQHLTASKSTISFAPKDKLDDSTTYKKNMQDYSYSNLNHKVCAYASKSVKIKVPVFHFKTTNNTYFNNNAKYHPDRRLYKSVLISRSSSMQKKSKPNNNH